VRFIAEGEKELGTPVFFLIKGHNGHGRFLLVGTLDLTLLRDVDTVQELTNILVLNGGGLLDVGSRLGDISQVVTGQDDLILLVLGDNDLDTLQHGDLEENLLTNKVTDLNRLLIISNNDVDGEMGIDETHLVLVTLGDTNDHVVDQRADGAEASNVLALAVPDSETETGRVELDNIHVNMTEVLGQGTTGTSNGDDTGLDINLDIVRDGENLFLVDILHCVLLKKMR